MREKTREWIAINDRLSIVKRDERQGLFYFRARIDGHKGYVFRTTGTYDRSKAEEIAREKFYELQSLAKQGIVVHAKGEFEKVYADFSRDVLVHKSPSRLAQFEGTYRRYFLPFFGQKPIKDINEHLIETYFTWRVNYHASEEVKKRQEQAAVRKRGRKPAAKTTKRRSTLKNFKRPSAATLKIEKGLLKEILSYAARRGLIVRLPEISLPRSQEYRNAKRSRRDHFTRVEMRKLRDYLQSLVSEEPDPNVRKNNGKFSKEQKGARKPHALHRYQRQVLRELVLILANTGLRIGEALKLTWGDLKRKKTRNGFEYLYLQVRGGKTGAREVIPKADAVTYFARLKEISTHTESTDFIFQNRDGSSLKEPGVTFKKVLRDLDMLTGPDGNPRSLYSLRHTYITNELELGQVTIHDIANNCGTSITYIERHYSHAKVHSKAQELAEKVFGKNDVKGDMAALFA
jgi:integrase